MPANQIKITVHVNKANIRCTPNGGNAHLHQGKRDQLQWVSEDPSDKSKWFTLAFTNLDTGKPVPWPFQEAQKGWPTGDTGPLTVHVPNPQLIIKYDVQVVGSNTLDPIIIVDN